MSKTSYVFRLYVAGNAPNSLLARANLARFAEERCAGSYTIEEVDVLKDPKKALEDHVMLTPTLVLLKPDPSRRVIGNLSDREKLARALGI